MKVKNKNEKVIKCANFKDIAEGECFYDDSCDAIMMKVNSISAVNLISGRLAQYKEQAYVSLVDAEVVWEFRKW